MKFSFDSEKYRKSLAEDLIKKRKESKEGAKELLKQEKETHKYKVASEIKNINELARKTIRGAEDAEKEKNKDIEIEEIDINDIIPDEIRVYLDEVRLSKIYEDLGRKYTGHKDSKNREEMRTIAAEFVDELTEGDLLNPKRLNHVINGYASSRSLIGAGTGKRVIESKVEDEDEKIFLIPYSRDYSNDPLRKIDTSRAPSYTYDSGQKGLFFASGGSHWYAPEKELVICNPYSQRFKGKISFIKLSLKEVVDISSEMDDEQINELLDRAIEECGRYKESGVLIGLKDQIQFISWADIADWIVDLVNGKLYKITESKREEEQSSDKKNKL